MAQQGLTKAEFSCERTAVDATLDQVVALFKMCNSGPAGFQLANGAEGMWQITNLDERSPKYL